jgi:uncharacterized Zn finger protein (UPF0148 family)
MNEDNVKEFCEDCGSPTAEYDGVVVCQFCIEFNRQVCEECEE